MRIPPNDEPGATTTPPPPPSHRLLPPMSRVPRSDVIAHSAPGTAAPLQPLIRRTPSTNGDSSRPAPPGGYRRSVGRGARQVALHAVPRSAPRLRPRRDHARCERSKARRGSVAVGLGDPLGQLSLGIPVLCDSSDRHKALWGTVTARSDGRPGVLPDQPPTAQAARDIFCRFRVSICCPAYSSLD
jgi:hypothetical protein